MVECCTELAHAGLILMVSVRAFAPPLPTHIEKILTREAVERHENLSRAFAPPLLARNSDDMKPCIGHQLHVLPSSPA